MQDFEGKVAVVTGAASGIGLATAQRFAEEGMRVVLADIEEPALAAAVQALTEAGHTAVGVPTDVASAESVAALADATMAQFGAVHVVHNNAGVVVAGPIAELSIADWEWVLGVDLWSVIYGVRTFLPLIKASGGGHIVNTASTAGLQATPGIAPYSVAKFGVLALTETLRLELDRDPAPVSASVLCPGAINTRIATSDRNRSAASAATHDGSEVEANFFRTASALLAEQGLSPAEVAAQVVAAIRADQFWIVTHPEWHGVLAERLEQMRAGDLYHGFGG